MTETIQDTDDPSSTKPSASVQDSADRHESLNGTKNGGRNGLFGLFKSILSKKSDATLRETIEEYIDVAENSDTEITSISVHERALIANILKLRDNTVTDVMIPRADIFAIDIETSEEELLSDLTEKQHSRIPVYRGTLDEVVGTVHIKDVLACLASKKEFKIEDVIREVPIVSPSMKVPDLLLLMKQMRKHMALVVDEFGGIDGLVTINDVIESIVGEIDDEYDQDDDPEVIENSDGSLTVDARFDLEEFEEKYGQIFTEEEREDADTIGGLVTTIAGRVPARGEIVTHDNGMVFEVLDADPRRVNRLRVKNIPLPEQAVKG